MLRKILPHAAIIISAMYFLFYAIDGVNSAMAFINNDITKFLLLILCIISVVNAVLIVSDDRKRTRSRRQEARRHPAPVRPNAPQQRPVQRREYDRYARPEQDYRRPGNRY